MVSSLILTLFYLNMAYAQVQPAPTDRDFEVRRDHLRQRYADFYILMNDKDRRDAERQRAAAETRSERQKLLKVQEEHRKEFVKNRRAKIEPSPDAHEKELEQQRADRVKALAEYRKKQKKLKDIERQVGVIPDWMEYELYDTYEASESP